MSASVSAADPSGEPLTFQWGASGGTVDGNGPTATWTLPRDPGTFTITVAAITARGEKATCASDVTVQVAAPRPPPPPDLPIPQLPKLPPWSLAYTLPDGLAIKNSNEDLGTIYDRIRDAFNRANISNDHSATYAIGTDGFAVVTHVEYIDDLGGILTPRWSVQPPQKFPTSLSAFWHGLFAANPGRYRVIVMVVTSRELQSLKDEAQEPTPEQMSKLLRQGDDRIPDALRQTAGTPNRRCVAIIYEFYRASSAENLKVVSDSNISGPDHLSAAGLWPRGDLP